MIEAIDAVVIEIGALSGVDKSALGFAWDLATAGTVAAGSRLEFRDVPLKVKCPSCGRERSPEQKWQLACLDCPKARPHIMSGRELNIVALEVPN
jgi:hydrogenase nickel incorporation protein HypA/HybF